MKLEKIKLPIDVEDDFICNNRRKAISKSVGRRALILDWHLRELLCYIKGEIDSISYNVITFDGKDLRLAYHDLCVLYLL